MRCSVLIVLAASCLTARGQHNSQGAEADITTTSPPDSITTLQGDFNTPQESGSGGQIAKIIVTEPKLENGRVPQRENQLVVCSCPELTPEGCRSFLSGTSIDSKDELYEDIRRPVAELKVVVHNVTCQKKDHRLMKFNEGQFYYRQRGDLVLRDAGDMTGLRANDFCADLRPDEYGNSKWNIKICVAPPSVPRCCPAGQTLKDGACQDANTPVIFEPPISVDISGEPISWPVIQNHYHPLTCADDPLKSIPLVPNESTLMAHPSGIIHVWLPADGHSSQIFTRSPDLCVDGYVDSYGSVVYSANICYTDPVELHQKVCDGHTCVRKCCQDDEEMNLSLYRCTSSNSTVFEPRFTSPPQEYKVVNGKPLCPFHTLIGDATLDSEGYIYFNEKAYSPKDYCVDTFTDASGKIEDKALVCIKESKRPWEKAFPALQIISVFFLLLIVACYCLAPELLHGGGCYQLFHVLSLMLGYATMFSLIFSKSWGRTTCIAMALVLQFAFLAAFFWLNVMCFEMWRKIRNLNFFRPVKFIPAWVYMLYGFGVPVAIGTLTVCMQFFAPNGVPGVVKPNLAQSRCFFPDRTTLFLYFYGPIAFLFALNIAFIAHTYWIYRKFEKNTSIQKTPSPETACERSLEHSQCKEDFMSDFKQHFALLLLMSSCWVAEVLSSLIPPPELWALMDLLNSLQGVFIFVFFVANRRKRKYLKKKIPLPFNIAHDLRNALRRCCCRGGAKVAPR